MSGSTHEYQEKRDFRKTDEPAGGEDQPAGGEDRGRPEALPTEDHPMEYAGFEGVIPEDEYGGGTVIVWDRGTYTNLKEDDDGEPVPVADQVSDGHVTLRLDGGEKLAGGYALTRMEEAGDGGGSGAESS